MKANDVRITSGVVESIEAQGNVYIYGGVVNRITANGDCRQYGGIVERRIQMTGQDQPRVVYKDRIVVRKEVSYLENPEHKRIIANQKAEIEKLRNELLKKEDEKPTDDVLVRKIISLQNELEAEKAAHKKEAEELKERIGVAMEINAKLRRHNEEVDKRDRDIAENHIDILATMMALYPFAVDDDIVFEFGIPKEKIRWVAQTFGLIKSKEARQDAREYLRKQGLDLIERRGGDQTKENKSKKAKKK